MADKFPYAQRYNQEFWLFLVRKDIDPVTMRNSFTCCIKKVFVILTTITNS